MSTVAMRLDRAIAGEAITYHLGASLKGCNAAHLAQVRRLYDAGRVDLVQKRVDEGFAYVAQFRRQHAKVLETFASVGLLS